jgi:hypothetical protein
MIRVRIIFIRFNLFIYKIPKFSATTSSKLKKNFAVYKGIFLQTGKLENTKG